MRKPGTDAEDLQMAMARFSPWTYILLSDALPDSRPAPEKLQRRPRARCSRDLVSGAGSSSSDRLTDPAPPLASQPAQLETALDIVFGLTLGACMKILKYLTITLVVIIGGLFAYGQTLPNSMHMERSTLIAAPASAIYSQIDNYRSFNLWSPWAQYDPNAKYTIEGPARGVGARQSWAGNAEIGSGSQQIIETKPYTLIKSSLVFGGFEAHRYVSTFSLEPRGDDTRVTWSFDGEFGGNALNQIVSRYFALMMGDSVGKDYDRGLSNLKKLAESLPKTDFSALNVEEVSLQAQAIAAISGQSSPEVGEIGKAYAVAYAKIVGFIKTNGLRESGPPLAITRKWDTGHKIFMFDAGIPVNRNDVAVLGGEVRLMKTYAGKALKVTHRGPYATMPQTYEMLHAYMKAYGYEKSSDEWEEYVSDPGKTPESELITHIFYPVK
jgi:effector-binding domain-containing protein